MQRVFVWLLLAVPLFYTAWQIYTDNIGPDPAKKWVLLSGECTLTLLLVTLFISTLARWLRPARILIKYRRLIGLWVFFYASVHVFIFAALYVGFDLALLGEELVERPYIAIGFLAWCFLLPLALTSNAKAIRSLGARKWKQVHRLVYLVLIMGLVHVVWQVRSDWSDVFYYSLAGGLLLLERLHHNSKKKK